MIVRPVPSLEPHKSKSPDSKLIVEDEFLIRLMLEDNLREAGYRVIETSNADDAAVIISASAPQLIVTDIRMPGRLDGLGLLAFVRVAHPTLPVVVVSAHNNQFPERNRYTHFLPKPYQFEKLAKIVERALKT